MAPQQTPNHMRLFVACTLLLCTAGTAMAARAMLQAVDAPVGGAFGDKLPFPGDNAVADVAQAPSSEDGGLTPALAPGPELGADVGGPLQSAGPGPLGGASSGIDTQLEDSILGIGGTSTTDTSTQTTTDTATTDSSAGMFDQSPDPFSG